MPGNGLAERRGRDSNSRRTERPEPVFETGVFFQATSTEGPLAVLGQSRLPSGWWQYFRVGHTTSSKGLTAAALEDDAAVGCRPRDDACNLRLSGERSEPIPDRRFERVTELVASGPLLHIDQLVAIESTQHDPVDAPAAAAERHGCDRRATPLELGPHVVAREQLVAPLLEPQSTIAQCGLLAEQGDLVGDVMQVWLAGIGRGPGGPSAISRVRPRSALEMRRCSVTRFPSTFRPLDSPRPYSDHHGRSLCFGDLQGFRAYS